MYNIQKRFPAVLSQEHPPAMQGQESVKVLSVTLVDDMDWVTERFKCKRVAVLGRLFQRMKEDIEIFKQLEAGCQIIIERSDTAIWADWVRIPVPIQRPDPRASRCRIEMNMDGSFALTFSDPNTSARFVPTVDDDGRCRLRDNGGILLEVWQVSRRALEPLMFA